MPTLETQKSDFATGKTVTILDVARQTGLSKTTVSAALTGNGRLSEATRELVLREAEKLGYQADYFAQGLRKKNNDLIGFFSPDIDLGVSTLKMQKMWSLLDARGYTVPILAYGNREGGEFLEQEQLLSELRRQKPRAILCNTSNLQSEAAHAELQRYLNEGGVAVCYDWEVPVETDQVIFDREHNTYIAASHLLQAGHRKIGAALPQVRQGVCGRTNGFERALREFGVTPNSDWLWTVDYGQLSEPEGVKLAERFLALPADNRPSALCIVNDYVAHAFALCVMRAGLRIPADLSLVSHDNLPIAQYGALALSSVSHPYEEIARHAVEMLDARLCGRADPMPRREIVRGQLFERGSVCPPGQ